MAVPTRARRLRLTVAPKFLLTVSALVVAVLSVAGVGVSGLHEMSVRSDAVYRQTVARSQRCADVTTAVLTVQETSLYVVSVQDPALQQQLEDELAASLLPRLELSVDALAHEYAGDADASLVVAGIGDGLRGYLTTRASGVLDDGTLKADPVARTKLAKQIDDLITPIADAADTLRQAAQRDSAVSEARAQATYRSTVRALLLSALGVLLLGLALALALIRNVVPRIRHYARFASALAAGETAPPLRPRGNDELTELGVALEAMVQQRDRADAQDAERREAQARADRRQTEFLDTLQVARSEEEAHELLQHHLRRCLPGSEVAVLRRNNSANRLEVATQVAEGDDLPQRLQGVEPRACVAVRLGRTHLEGDGTASLLACTLCGSGDRSAACEPLLVGGEVIGSVLVTADDGLDPSAEGQVRASVSQAAPVLANLRTLALAEFRANSDSLTGLPNKRATEDTLKRMVAQASRSLSPLAAVMLDLDHFKQINDRFGHAHGDEVLAAVGAAVQATLRASDFAGRIGGEEFLLLLPGTGPEGALQLSERLRRTIATISIPGVERDITASLGVACLLEHAGNAAGLLHEADKALYAAKASGRNRTVVAVEPDRAEPDTVEAPPVEPDVLAGAEGTSTA